MKTILAKTGLFLLPAKTLVGRLVSKPKGNNTYKCSNNPESTVYYSDITSSDRIIGNYVFLNKNGVSSAFPANKDLKVALTREELCRFVDKYQIDSEYYIGHYKNGTVQQINLINVIGKNW